MDNKTIRDFANAGVLALLGVMTAPAQAELIILKSGGQAEGELINTSRDARDPVQLRTAPGLKVAIPADQIVRIIVKSDLQKQYEILAPKYPDTVDGQWQLAEWCRQAELAPERLKHLESILRLDSEHEPARLALGYVKFGGAWVKPDEWMRSQGYVRYQGAWRMRQEVEIDVRHRQFELSQKQWLLKVKQWCDQIVRGRRGEEALANIKAIKDPAAGPALLDIVSDTRMPDELRLLCLELVSNLSNQVATNVMIKLSLEDPSGELRDRALEELRKQQSVAALVAFTKLLTNKDNRKVQRAGYCLERLGNPEATLPLINALVTTHHYLVSQGGSPGGIGASFGGSGGDGGLGGMSMGGKPKDVKVDQKNDRVLSALTALHPGVNYSYDEDSWRKWYAETHTTADVNLRRDK